MNTSQTLNRILLKAQNRPNSAEIGPIQQKPYNFGWFLPDSHYILRIMPLLAQVLAHYDRRGVTLTFTNSPNPRLELANGAIIDFLAMDQPVPRGLLYDEVLITERPPHDPFLAR